MLSRLWFQVCIAPLIYVMLWEFAFTGGPFNKNSVRFEARLKLIAIHAFIVLAGIAAVRVLR